PEGRPGPKNRPNSRWTRGPAFDRSQPNHFARSAGGQPPGLWGVLVLAHLELRGHRLQVLVRDNNVDQALKALKKKMQREGIFREMKLRNYFEKPSEKKAREKAEAVRRARKLARKKLQR